MASKKTKKTKKTKKRKKPSPRRAASKKPKKKAPTRAKRKRAAPKTRKAVKAPAIPPPKTFVEKLRDANAEIDVDGHEMEDEAEAGETDERDVGDAEEGGGDAHDTSEQE